MPTKSFIQQLHEHVLGLRESYDYIGISMLQTSTYIWLPVQVHIKCYSHKTHCKKTFYDGISPGWISFYEIDKVDEQKYCEYVGEKKYDRITKKL